MEVSSSLTIPNLNLQSLCIESLSQNILAGVSFRNKKPFMPTLGPSVTEKVFQQCIKIGAKQDHNEANRVIQSTFSDSETFPLRTIDIHKAFWLEDKTLSILLKKNPSVIHLDLCYRKVTLSKKVACSLDKLQSLKITSDANILWDNLYCPNLESLGIYNYNDNPYNNDQSFFNFPSLKRYSNSLVKFIKKVTPNLKHLEISKNTKIKIKSFRDILFEAKSLVALVLHDQPSLSSLLDELTNLKDSGQLSRLIALDIGCTPGGKHSKESISFSTIITLIKSFPKLEYLDISGRVFMEDEFENVFETFECTHFKTIRFLGVYKTKFEDEWKKILLGKRVAGSSFSNELINGLQVNINRPKIIRLILLDILQLQNPPSLSTPEGIQLLRLVLWDVLNQEIPQDILEMGVECLIKLFEPYQDFSSLDDHWRRQLIQVLMNLIENQKNQIGIVDKTFQIFNKLTIPCDVTYCFKEFTKVLLLYFDLSSITINSLKIVSRLLVKLTSENDVSKALLFNNMKLIEKCLNLVQILHLRQASGPVLRAELKECIWETMRNVLKQQSEQGCEDFLKLKGLNWMYSYCTLSRKQLQGIEHIFKDIVSCMESYICKREITIIPFNPKEKKKELYRFKKAKRCLTEINKRL